jgi:hypothetical protein
MSIKQNGGVFGRNPTFNNVTIEGQLTFDGDIDINSDLKVDGDIETTGNVIIATSGKGIDFSATAGTGTSELLDDYEEGTWTPTITGSTGGAASFTVSTSSYTKIGNTVRLSCYLSGADVTGLSGNVRLGGFPFPASGYHFCVSGYCNFFGFDESDISVGLYTESGQSFSNFLRGSSTVSITAADATTSSGGTIMFNLTYKTT